MNVWSWSHNEFGDNRILSAYFLKLVLNKDTWIYFGKEPLKVMNYVHLIRKNTVCFLTYQQYSLKGMQNFK